MKSSNLVSMNDRLNRLRFSLGVDWGNLAKSLEISRSMLGFIRRGDKTPSPKLAHRISELEKSLGSQSVATCPNCEMLLNRVIELEKQLMEADRMSDSKGQAVLNLIRAVDSFKETYVGGAKQEVGPTPPAAGPACGAADGGRKERRGA